MRCQGKEPLDERHTHLAGKGDKLLILRRSCRFSHTLVWEQFSAFPGVLDCGLRCIACWPSALCHPANGLAEMQRCGFSAEEYGTGPILPTNKLPDFRGEFIRGWDGRGVDGGELCFQLGCFRKTPPYCCCQRQLRVNSEINATGDVLQRAFTEVPSVRNAAMTPNDRKNSITNVHFSGQMLFNTNENRHEILHLIIRELHNG